MGKYNTEGLLGLVPDDLPESWRIACGWFLHRINNGERLFYSERSTESKFAIDVLVRDEILEIQNDEIKFSQKFENFIKEYKG